MYVYIGRYDQWYLTMVYAFNYSLLNYMVEFMWKREKGYFGQ